jgi:geranylgeranyl reductase family protein
VDSGVVDADVIVSGAGPAGAVAARTLAAAGLNVLLLDKAAFPRNKPCGGGISMRAFARFPWLADAIKGIDFHSVSRLQLESPNGRVLELESREPSVALVRRVEFDHALVREAVGAGAALRERFEVTQVETSDRAVTLQSRSGERVSAPFVIAADGVHSVIAKRSGANARWPPRSIAIDMMEETPVDTLRAARPDVLWVAYAYRGLDGYAYVFPKLRHVNVGIGCLLSHYRDGAPVTSAPSARVTKDAPYTMQSRFVGELVAGGALHGRSSRACFTPFLIPVGGPLPRASRGRVLFAGDAGGFVNAFTAEGIVFAMISGELAARAVIAGRGIAAPDAGDVYHRLWRAEIGSELRDAVLIQRFLFADRDRVNRVVAAGQALPWIADLIVDYASGRITYRDARRRVLAASPRTAAKLAWLMVRRRLAG